LFRDGPWVTFSELEFYYGVAVEQYRQDADEKEQGCSGLYTIRHQMPAALLLLENRALIFSRGNHNSRT